MPFFAGLAVTVVVYFVVRDDLPSRVPTHFGTGGADGYGSPGRATAGNLVVYAIEGVLFLIASLAREEQRTVRPTLVAAWAVSVTTTYFLCALLLAGDGSVPAYQYAAAPAAGGAVVLGSRLLSRRKA
ncbi:hypothetical protein AC230_29885 [Streptomyces caatingaensis]|uniref:DUF1648 domain-containing protein n=1 Tax=Streptomyces caatingaensis TaxID=1678637 RepID=A0A0K9X7N2_9ACTN|nr:hypothetical protein AC230_29885 [Streptomyces caatingaensis]